MKKPKIGVALGSGGARGWCHIGVLQALNEMGVKPDVVAGCSMGALVGAAYAGGRLAELEAWARSLTRSRFVSLIDIRPNSGGLVEGKEITRLISALGLPERIEDLPLPFISVATDLSNGREVWLRDGNLASAVRASVSMPGVFSPHKHGDNWLLDGGLTNPVPVSVCRAMGAEVVIAVNPNARTHGTMWHHAQSSTTSAMLLASLPDSLREKVGTVLNDGNRNKRHPAYFDVAVTAIDIMTEQIRRSRLAGDPPHVLLNVDLHQISVLELFRADEAIRKGARIAKSQQSWILECVNPE